MQKLLILVFSSSLALSLSACGRRLPSTASLSSPSAIQSKASTDASDASDSDSSSENSTPANSTPASAAPVATAPVYTPPANTAYTQPTQSYRAPAVPTPPPSVQLRPDLYANPYRPQDFGQRPVATGMNTVGNQAPYPNAYPQANYAGNYNTNTYPTTGYNQAAYGQNNYNAAQYPGTYPQTAYQSYNQQRRRY